MKTEGQAIQPFLTAEVWAKPRPHANAFADEDGLSPFPIEITIYRKGLICYAIYFDYRYVWRREIRGYERF
ncbi:MAG: hypothetical protein LBR54_04305 [Oscillospiraceae bacterium]|nr:hypothetical protein [Oscillospiraceae bacterium]